MLYSLSSMESCLITVVEIIMAQSDLGTFYQKLFFNRQFVLFTEEQYLRIGASVSKLVYAFFCFML